MKDDKSEDRDVRVWHGLLGTYEVHPRSMDGYIVQKSRFGGATLILSRSRWVMSNLLGMFGGGFVMIMCLVGGMYVEDGDGAPLYTAGILTIPFFVYALAVFSWSLRKSEREEQGI